jgi:hypothetical protein
VIAGYEYNNAIKTILIAENNSIVPFSVSGHPRTGRRHDSFLVMMWKGGGRNSVILKADWNKRIE